MRRPEWWDWDLALTPYAERRMAQRGLSELELRAMLERARGYRRGPVPGRWRTMATHRGEAWRVIVEPDEVTRRVVVVTVYPEAD